MAQEIYNFEDVKEEVEEAIRNIFPVAGNNLTLDINDVIVDDNKNAEDVDEQYRKVTRGYTWSVPVYADLSLRDKNGEVDRRRVKILNLPKMTDRKTFIVDGKERQLPSILRRKSGIFSRHNEKGKLISEFNLDNGLHDGGRVSRGQKFKIHFDDQKKEFYAEIGTKKKSVKAYDLLKALGYNTDTLKARFGESVHQANQSSKRRENRSINAAYSAIYESKYARGSTPAEDLSIPEKKKLIRESFERTEVDPETVKATLGRPANKVDADVLVSAMDKLLKISRGQEEEDDRESLLFKHTASPPRLIREGITSPKMLRRIQGKIRGKLNQSKNKRPTTAEEALPTTVLDEPVHRVLKDTDDSEVVDHANPVGTISGFNRVSMLGTGAIKNIEQIPKDAPLVSPSHFGYIDPLHSPESEKIGISLHLPMGIRARKDGKLIQKMVTPEGKEVDISAEEAAQSTVAFSDEFDVQRGKKGFRVKSVKDKVLVQRRGKIEEVDPSEVDYILPEARSVFGAATNLVPFLQSNQGNRAMMAGKHSTQALPLKNREQPLVQTGMEEEMSSHAGARRAPVSGRITSVRKKDGAYEIRIKPKDGGDVQSVKAYRDFPMAGGLIMDSDVKVKKGDRVNEGDLLADSSFTKDGVLSMGTTLKTAYMPWKGYAFEDGVVISEKAADKLTSVHLHEKSKKSKDMIRSKTQFLNWFGTRIQSNKERRALDEDGVVRKGQTVEPGQLLLAGLRPIDPKKEDVTQRKRAKLGPYDPITMTWDKDVPGVVTDVKKNPDGSVRVFVKTEEKMKEGDKLVGRNANKGIVVKILPTEEMPHTKDGAPVDIIMSPLGIPGRINLGQVLEAATGKVAEKRGQPIKVKPFERKDYITEAKNLLKAEGLPEDATEELVDPTRSDRSYGKVMVGPQYIMKLEHQISKKARARSTGKYDRWDTPVGGDGGAQSLGELGTYGLLAHGAVENLRDMQLLKSQKNDGLWDALIHGKPIPVPNHITQNERFEGLLRVAGVKLSKGDTISLLPQTDEDTDRMAMGRKGLKDPGRMLWFNRGRVTEEEEGIFDPVKTGGQNGDRWSYFDLPEPEPNPLFRPAISALTGWSEKKILSISQGKDAYNGETGGQAIKNKLSEIDLDEHKTGVLSQIEEVKSSRLKSESKAKKLSKLYEKLRIVENLQKNEKRPEDVFVMSKVPVMPPRLRPITSVGSGERVADDINHLYRDLALVSNTLKEQKEKWNLPDSHLKPLRSAVTDGMSALVQSTSNDKPLSGAYQGIIGTIIGKRPKEKGRGETGESKKGLFQDKITRRRQDFSGRSTITVEPRLKVDEVGLPFEMAYELYKPWAIKKMGEHYGYSSRRAREYYRDKGHEDPRVRKVLIETSRDRPVLVKRDPTLHKFNVMSFHPQLVDGKAIQIHPLVTGGFNADFDGDQMSVYVPMSQKAVDESYNLLPSKNLFSPANGRIVHKPSHEMVWGLSTITEVGKKTGKSFSTLAAARSALRKGEIDATDVIKVGPRETTMGWEEINSTLPKRYRIHGSLKKRSKLDGKKINQLLTTVAEKDPEKFAEVANQLKDIGNRFSTEKGLSVTLDDFSVIDKDYRDAVFADAEDQVSKGADPIQTYGSVIKKLDHHNLGLLRDGKVKNNLFGVVESGARANWGQLKQIISSPAMVYDAQNRIVPRLIKSSYSEGLSLADYWTSTHGARKGAINKAISTRRPGYLSKQIMRTSIDQVVTEDDCGTTQGIFMDTNDPETQGRYLAHGIRIKGAKRNRNIKRNTLVTPNVTNALKAGGVGSVLVRSPMRCEATSGVCAKCMGVDEAGEDSSVGTNVGVISAQSIGEPSTQLSLNVFHKGGIVDDPDRPVEGDRLSQVENLLGLTKEIPNQAILSPKTGKIEAVKPASQGGYDIQVSGKSIYVPHGKRLFDSVKPGRELRRGDPLTAGPVHPLEVMKLKGAYAAQKSLVDQMYELFRGGKGVKKKHFEVVARGMMKHTRVIDEKNSDFKAGQPANLMEVKSYNHKQKPGDRVTHLPIVKGVGMAPLVSENWVARLNAERLRDTIVSAANQGWESDTKGPHPIPALTFLGEDPITEGSGFGRPVRSLTDEAL